ncbi:MAG: hypothetical protein WCF85_22490 [Rhodospirillaceae bacterium]
MKDFAPKYYVYWSDTKDVYRQPSTQVAWEKHLRRPSFLQQYFHTQGGDTRLSVDENPADGRPALTAWLRPVYSNACFEVATVAYTAPPVASPHLGTWVIEGRATLEPRFNVTEGLPWPRTSISLPPQSKLQMYGDKPVTAGEQAAVTLTLWGDRPATLRATLSRGCTSTEYESTDLSIEISKTPTRYDISHLYKNDHGCARLSVLNPTTEAVKFNLGPAELRY